MASPRMLLIHMLTWDEMIKQALLYEKNQPENIGTRSNKLNNKNKDTANMTTTINTNPKLSCIRNLLVNLFTARSVSRILGNIDELQTNNHNNTDKTPITTTTTTTTTTTNTNDDENDRRLSTSELKLMGMNFDKVINSYASRRIKLFVHDIYYSCITSYYNNC